MEAALFPPEEYDVLLTLEEAAKRLRKTPDTLRRWVKNGDFPQLVQVQEERKITYSKIVPALRVRASDVRAWLESHGQVPRPIDRQAA